MGSRMLLENETKEKFGYTLSDLTEKSSKTILLGCDYCHIIYESSKKRREIAHRVIANDCCKKCKYKKMAEMNQIKYGVDNVFQLKSVKQKIASTNVEKYGVPSPQQNEEVRQKSRKTCLEKYGVENVFQSPEVRAKMEVTNLERYGGVSPTSSEEIKNKVRATNLEKFGTECYFVSQDCKDKVMEKYGVENVFQLEEVKRKIKSTNIEKYGVDHAMKVPEIARMAQDKGLETKIAAGQINLHENKGIAEWAKELGFSKSHFNTLVNRHGWDIAVSMQPKMSSLEKIMEEILIEIGEKYIKQIKIKSYYADFVVGELVIEVDGIFWHSDFHKEDDYHVRKRLTYIDEGYIPLFFREDELLSKREIIKSIILNKLGKNERLYARKLELKESDKKEGSEFLGKNHLMGRGQGRCFTLSKDGQILACLRMKKIKDGWEISRFATKSGISIVGGFSRLISFFKRIVGDVQISTFVDLRYGSGDYLPSLGFESSTSYPSFKWTNGSKTFHRMTFSGNSGYENGMLKIWDCGQMKFVYKPR